MHDAVDGPQQLGGRRQAAGVVVDDAILLATHGAATHFAGKVRLQSDRLRLLEHLAVVDDGQPEGGQRVIVIAATVTVAFYNRGRTELLQAGAGRNQILAITSSIIRGVLEVIQEIIAGLFSTPLRRRNSPCSN